ncbi:hypothetical protein, partial [Pseudomonas guariconensis]|uniref:hypothetical protein n=1 Tax=Pseudomonas guariconensis TaxID=1288410 RepID=UPI001E46520C
VSHNEKCSVSFDTEHSLKGPGRLLGFHTVCGGAFFIGANIPTFMARASPLIAGKSDRRAAAATGAA